MPTTPESDHQQLQDILTRFKKQVKGEGSGFGYEQTIADLLAWHQREMAEAEDKARFEIAYRLLLGAEGNIFIPKSMFEVPLTDYEITTYPSPDPGTPGVLYELSHPTKEPKS